MADRISGDRESSSPPQASGSGDPSTEEFDEFLRKFLAENVPATCAACGPGDTCASYLLSPTVASSSMTGEVITHASSSIPRQTYPTYQAALPQPTTTQSLDQYRGGYGVSGSSTLLNVGSEITIPESLVPGGESQTQGHVHGEIHLSQVHTAQHTYGHQTSPLVRQTSSSMVEDFEQASHSQTLSRSPQSFIYPEFASQLSHLPSSQNAPSTSEQIPIAGPSVVISGSLEVGDRPRTERTKEATIRGIQVEAGVKRPREQISTRRQKAARYEPSPSTIALAHQRPDVEPQTPTAQKALAHLSGAGANVGHGIPIGDPSTSLFQHMDSGGSCLEIETSDILSTPPTGAPQTVAMPDVHLASMGMSGGLRFPSCGYYHGSLTASVQDDVTIVPVTAPYPTSNPESERSDVLSAGTTTSVTGRPVLFNPQGGNEVELTSSELFPQHPQPSGSSLLGGSVMQTGHVTGPLSGHGAPSSVHSSIPSSTPDLSTISPDLFDLLGSSGLTHTTQGSVTNVDQVRPPDVQRTDISPSQAQTPLTCTTSSVSSSGMTAGTSTSQVPRRPYSQIKELRKTIVRYAMPTSSTPQGYSPSGPRPVSRADRSPSVTRKESLSPPKMFIFPDSATESGHEPIRSPATRSMSPQTSPSPGVSPRLSATRTPDHTLGTGGPSETVREKLYEKIRQKSSSVSCEDEAPVSESDREMTPEEIAKKLKRREQNRRAAQRCREKKRQAAEGVFMEFRRLQSTNTGLQHEIKKLSKQKEDLSKTLDAHMRHCPGPGDYGPGPGEYSPGPGEHGPGLGEHGPEHMGQASTSAAEQQSTESQTSPPSVFASGKQLVSSDSEEASDEESDTTEDEE